MRMCYNHPSRIRSILFAVVLFFALTACPHRLSAACGDPAAEVDGVEVEKTDRPEEIALSADLLEEAPVTERVEDKKTGKTSEQVSSFAFRRLILSAPWGVLKDSFGAEQIAYYNPGQDYILDYPTEEAAARAYEKLSAHFGKDAVLPDLPVLIQGLPYSETSSLSSSWGNDLMHLDRVRDQSNQDPSLTSTVTVAVLDTGIYTDHELFAGRISSQGVSFVQDDVSFEDVNGHGSHVAGTIADGSSRQVKILPVKVLGLNGRGGFYEVVKGIKYAADHGAEVINLSIGICLSDYDNQFKDQVVNLMEDALCYAQERGCIIVTAAGNRGEDTSLLDQYPAGSARTIAVSAMTSGKSRLPSSNYGSCIDFTAPGESICSAAISSRSDYRYLSGTSMAAPHITAACAMLRLYDKSLSVSAVKEKLISLSRDLGSPGKDADFGYGLVVFPDNGSSLHKKETSSTTPASPASASGQSKSNPVRIKKGKTYKVSGQVYQVLKAATGKSKGTVLLYRAKNSRRVQVPSSVRLADRRVYRVIRIRRRAFTGKKIRTVVIGSYVTRIDSRAFAGSKVVKVIIRTKKLRKTTVRGCLKSSIVKSIKIQLGTGRTGRRYLSYYKKVFTRKNIGKTIKIN